MRKKKIPNRQEVLGQMMTLATHPVNDAICLAYLPEHGPESIGSLDLTGLTEFKRNANGTVELKFTDRMTVLSALLDRLEEADSVGAAAFLQALEPTPSGAPAEPSRR